MTNEGTHKLLHFQDFFVLFILVKFIDFNGETETLAYFSKNMFCFGHFKKMHGFYLGNRDPDFHFSVFEMDNGICKYRK